HTVGINMIQGLGAKLVNARGEQFMEKYAPGIKDRAHLYTLAQAMAKESLESRGPIYADMRNFTPEAIEKCKRGIPRFLRRFGEAGIDIRGQIVELTPGVRFRAPTMPGGVRINIRCESTVLGLFAAGASTKGASHGADEGLGGLNLTSCNVSGHRAGENAVKQARGTDEPEVDQDQVESLLDNLRAPSRVKDGIFADEVFERVKATTIPARYSIFKNEKRMREVLKEVERVEQEDLPRVMAPDAHELVKANELKNYVLAVKLSYLAGLERKESRCYLYREEFPFQDNDNWLVWQIQRNEGGKVATRIERIPFERYPIEPPSGKIPAPVQYTFSD
ncbi:MAG: FAD-binding protein, partial [Chloroflexi bacterium]|nr:FAD-binding protein [Chloroflexota bacterium]